MMCWNWIRKKFFPSGGRQPYFQFEVTAPIMDLHEMLSKSGFIASPLSYWDTNEELNLRSLYTEFGSGQYRQLHARAFRKKGDAFEIFAHDEFMPETNPEDHYHAVTFRDLSDEQKKLLRTALRLEVK